MLCPEDIIKPAWPCGADSLNVTEENAVVFCVWPCIEVGSMRSRACVYDLLHPIPLPILRVPLVWIFVKKLCFFLYDTNYIHLQAQMFLAQPVTAPPPGQDPDFERPGGQSLVWAILLSNGLFIPLVTIVIAMRIYTKFSMTKQIFLDDCKCIAVRTVAIETLTKSTRSYDCLGYTLPGPRLNRCRRCSFGIWTPR